MPRQTPATRAQVQLKMPWFLNTRPATVDIGLFHTDKVEAIKLLLADDMDKWLYSWENVWGPGWWTRTKVWEFPDRKQLYLHQNAPIAHLVKDWRKAAKSVHGLVLDASADPESIDFYVNW